MKRTITTKQVRIVEASFQGCFDRFVMYADWSKPLDKLMELFEDDLRSTVYPVVDNLLDSPDSVIEQMTEEYLQNIQLEYSTKRT
jgi:hypothetical protein